MPTDEVLAEILVRRRVLSPGQLPAVRSEQALQAVGLVPAVARLGLASEEACCQAVAADFNLPYRDASREPTDPEAVKRLGIPFLKEARVLPLGRDGDRLIIALDDLTALGRVDEIGVILGCPTAAALTSPAALAAAFARLEQSVTGPAPQAVMDQLAGPADPRIDERPADDVVDLANEAPVIRLVNLILLQGINDGASDIHLEPYETELVVRYRIDGILQEGPKPPAKYRLAIISRLKIMARLDIAERRLPQDGRIKLKVMDREYDIRFSTLPGLHGESVVMRVLDQSRILYELSDIGLAPAMYDRLVDLINLANGVVLITGPTGSGKTTTLYASLNRLNQPDVKIITVEDPVEYRLRGVVQIQTNAAIGLTFAAALRSILRQDPDIVMIGEMRDLETATIGIQAALTGHLVFSTLHTNDAPSAVTRLLDLGVPAYLIAAVVRGVVAQRLARKICGACKESYQPTSQELLQLFGRESVGDVGLLHRGRGCEECRQTGYRGRLGLYELFVPDERTRPLILKGASAGELAQATEAGGMITLHADGVRKVLAGSLTVAELTRTAQADA